MCSCTAQKGHVRFLNDLKTNTLLLWPKLASVQVAMTHPTAVQSCNLDLEALISDSNRTIATLAITTLLKTGNESSLERLLKQIGSFMSDIADDFKIVVVEAIRTLCLKFPQKYVSCHRSCPFLYQGPGLLTPLQPLPGLLASTRKTPSLLQQSSLG